MTDVNLDIKPQPSSGFPQTPSSNQQIPDNNQPNLSTAAVSETKIKTNKKNILYILLGTLLLIVLGGGGFFLANMLNTPSKVKEKATIIQPIFSDYVDNITKIADNLKEETESDADSIEREVKKTENLIKEAEDNQQSLNAILEEVKTKQLLKYKKEILQYISKSKGLIDLAKESVKMNKGLISPMKDYQDLIITLSGVSNYIYSNPSKYVSTLNEVINKEKEVIKAIKSLDLKGSVAEYSQAMIKAFEHEVEFLEDQKKAVENRNNNQIAMARKKYAENTQEDSKEINRISDKLDNEVDNFIDELKKIQKQIKREYDRLKTAYKF